MTNPHFPAQAQQQPQPQPQPQAQAPAAAPSARPSGLVLAGAGSLVAVLAFLGGMAVGHAWDGSSTTPTQFGGPGGGGFRQFPGNGQQVPPGQTQPQQPQQSQQGQPG
jgi:hypothetical protein